MQKFCVVFCEDPFFFFFEAETSLLFVCWISALFVCCFFDAHLNVWTRTPFIFFTTVRLDTRCLEEERDILGKCALFRGQMWGNRREHKKGTMI